MTIALALGLLLSQSGAPWRTDLEAARADALRRAKPCVILLRVDCPAL